MYSRAQMLSKQAISIFGVDLWMHIAALNIHSSRCYQLMSQTTDKNLAFSTCTDSRLSRVHKSDAMEEQYVLSYMYLTYLIWGES